MQDLKKAIKRAKDDYRARLGRDSSANDPAAVWSTLRTVTNYKRKIPVATYSPRLAGDLNHCCSRP